MFLRTVNFTTNTAILFMYCPILFIQILFLHILKKTLTQNMKYYYEVRYYEFQEETIVRVQIHTKHTNIPTLIL